MNMLAVVESTQVATRMSELFSSWLLMAVCQTRGERAVAWARLSVCLSASEFWRETWKQKVKWMDGRVDLVLSSHLFKM